MSVIYNMQNLSCFISFALFFIKRFYSRDDKGRLFNVPYVDNSYKWAGGGILSTVGDLAKFGNHLLYSYQASDEIKTKYLTQNTIKSYLWSKQSVPETKYQNKSDLEPLVVPLEKVFYGMGWYLHFDNENKLKRVYHTGGALGATSCLLIVPRNNDNNNKSVNYPKGIVVAILCNLDNASGIANLCHQISKIYSE